MKLKARIAIVGGQYGGETLMEHELESKLVTIPQEIPRSGLTLPQVEEIRAAVTARLKELVKEADAQLDQLADEIDRRERQERRERAQAEADGDPVL